MFWTTNDMPTAVISGASRRRVAQRPVGDPLDRGVEERKPDHDHDERDREATDDREHARVDVEAEDADDDRARDEAGEREDVAVREVDQLQDAVDERVPERDEHRRSSRS